MSNIRFYALYPFVLAFYCCALIAVYTGDFIAAMYHKLRPIRNGASDSDSGSVQE